MTKNIVDGIRTKAPTVHDVAQRAGVSAQTVSRVVNGNSYVSAKTQILVETAIRELQYIPNSIARNLVGRGTKSIGLIVTDFAQGFFPDTTQSIERAATRHGYTVHIITALGTTGDHLQSAMEHFRRNQFAGVIINSGTREIESELRDAAKAGFPIVLVHRDLDGIDSVIKWDGYEKGASLAVDHLLSVGCRKIAFLSTFNNELIDKDKLRGYQNSLAAAGMGFDPTLVVHSRHDFEGGFNAILDALRLHPDLDGVFVTSDVRGVGVLRALAVNKISVPQDIAVVAFGASTMAKMVTPSLSTIRVPRQEMGELAADALFDLINGSAPRTLHVHDQPMLEVGESSLRIPKTAARLEAVSDVIT